MCSYTCLCRCWHVGSRKWPWESSLKTRLLTQGLSFAWSSPDRLAWVVCRPEELLDSASALGYNCAPPVGTKCMLSFLGRHFSNWEIPRPHWFGCLFWFLVTPLTCCSPKRGSALWILVCIGVGTLGLLTLPQQWAQLWRPHRPCLCLYFLVFCTGLPSEPAPKQNIYVAEYSTPMLYPVSISPAVDCHSTLQSSPLAQHLPLKALHYFCQGYRALPRNLR